MNVNEVRLAGKLGRDPEIRAVGSSKTATVSMATTKKWKDKTGEKKEKTEWHNLKFWNSQAELVERYCKKGTGLYVTGELETSSWGEGDNRKYKTEVVVSSMQFTDSKPSGQQSGTAPEQAPPSQSQGYSDYNMGDDLPF